MGAYLPTDGYAKPFYCSTYEIFTDALKNSKLGHKICRRFANKYVLFYIHQGLWCSLDLHLLHICDVCMTNAKIDNFFDFSDGLMASCTI
jgi:hypothetical protein